MRVNEQWLREWVDTDASLEALAEALTMAGLEVAGLPEEQPGWSGVVVARVSAVERHPGADALWICRVLTGEAEVQVITGAAGTVPGYYPFAPVGARLRETDICAVELRGECSDGMLCSAVELGLGDDAEELLHLDTDTPPGTPLETLLGLPDRCLELDLTPNRGDCLSLLGISRELAALTGAKFRDLPDEYISATLKDTPSISCEAPERCPRYLGRIVCGLDLTRLTPLWMTERLRRCGLRSLNLAVDVANYVMLELGQPLHTFDLQQFSGGVRIRCAQPGESIELLGGQVLELSRQDLVIADDRGPVALAGIMGSQPSAVGPQTVDVLLESAFFAPVSMAGRARHYGLHTDASHRFERGVDCSLQRRALERATALLLQIAGGQAGPVVEWVSEQHLPSGREVSLGREQLRRLLGVSLDDKIVMGTLSALQLQPRAEGNGWRVRIPPHRFDLEIGQDLVEEVARLYGYNNLPHQLPVMPITSGKRDMPGDRLLDFLAARDYHEAITYSFISAELARVAGESEPIALVNPISPDMAVMRPSLLPGLARALIRNRAAFHNRVRLCELGSVFPGVAANTPEHSRLAAVGTGTRVPLQHHNVDAALDFFDLKSDVQALWSLARGEQIELTFGIDTEAFPVFDSQYSALLSTAGTPVGCCGLLNQALHRALDITWNPQAATALWGFELELSALLRGDVFVAAVEPQYPPVLRDLSLVVPERVMSGEIVQQLRELLLPAGMRVAINILDRYCGEILPESTYGLTLSFRFCSDISTLDRDQINECMEQMLAVLIPRGIVIREE